MSLFSTTYRVENGSQIRGFLSFNVQGENYNPEKAGYTTILA